MKKNIEVVPYSLEWPKMFAAEAELTKQATDPLHEVNK
jgi:GrpB-like predicted nucleotidyltransferase (UPF0157 family)